MFHLVLNTPLKASNKKQAKESNTKQKEAIKATLKQKQKPKRNKQTNKKA